MRSAGPKMRPLMAGGFNQRPAPYDRSDRFGGMNRYGGGSMGPMSRGSRNFKGISKMCESNTLCVSLMYTFCVLFCEYRGSLYCFSVS